MKEKKLNVTKLTELGMLMAITIIMGTTTLGTIPTPVLDISLVTIPVAIAAINVGFLGGAVCGLTFGMTSFIRAATATTSSMTSLMFQISPFKMFITAVCARVLMGLITAGVYKLLDNVKALDKPKYFIAALFAPLSNTLLFMSCLMIFFYHSDFIQEKAVKLGATNPIGLAVAMVGIQGIVEAAVGMIVGGTVAFAVSKALKRK